jgi:hypothetical protein
VIFLVDFITVSMVVSLAACHYMQRGRIFILSEDMHMTEILSLTSGRSVVCASTLYEPDKAMIAGECDQP